jgi:hypothetical protein
MARGWESKDVENQKEDKELRSQGPQREKSALELRLEDLRLQRTRVLGDLAVAANPRYRALLEDSYRFLEGEIARLIAQDKDTKQGGSEQEHHSEYQ